MSTRRITVDMEATRLVFVMLKGAKPMRKVAIPITDTMSWHAFENQVKSKLRIRGIQAMTMAATGEVVTSLSQLQDIDQLHVIEAADVPVTQQPSQVTVRQTSVEIVSAANGVGAMLPQSSGGPAHHDEDGNAKYVKKKGIVASFLNGFRQGSLLPVTTSTMTRVTYQIRNVPTAIDSELPGPRKSRRQMRVLSLRNLTILLCTALIVLWVFRLFYHSPGATTLSSHDLPQPTHRPVAQRTPDVQSGRSVKDQNRDSPDGKQVGEHANAVRAETVQKIVKAQQDAAAQKAKAE